MSTPGPARLERWGSAHVLLVLACLVHAALALAFVVAHHMWWEQDETVYLSQVAAHTPALLFTPPRARGIPVLLFPVVHFTTRMGVIRTYLVLIGTAAMYAGLRPWLRLGFSRVVPGAALLFSTLWSASFFGAETQPNFLVAMLAVAATGYFLLAIGDEASRRDLLAVVGWVALLALLRPSDATWLCAALAVTMVIVKAHSGRQRLVVGGALAVGLVLGWSEWVIEAFASYGGFFHRLHEANADNTPGIHFSLVTQASAVNGPTLCRPCTQAVSVPHMVWWFAVPPLVVLGILAARGTRRFIPLVVATIVGTALLLEYLLTVAYAAPRFLLPTYALYSLPCAAGVGALATARLRAPVRAAIVVVLVALLGAQVVSQTHYLRSIVAHNTKSRGYYLKGARTLRAHHVHAPCVIYGPFGPPVAFLLHCNDVPQAPAVLPRVATGTTVIETTTAPGAGNPLPGSHPIRLFRTGPRHHTIAHILRGEGR